MIEARAKLTESLRQIIEDQARLELVTSPGKPGRDGYPATLMYAQRGTHTLLTIRADWYPGSALFCLTGPAVDAPDKSLWSERNLYRDGTGRQLRFRIFAEYTDGAKIDNLLWLTGTLLAQLPQG